MNKTQRHIMRRIYIAYALRIVAGARTRSMAVMFVSLLLLAKFVSVVSVLKNFSQVEVAEMVNFIFSAFRYTEMGTLLVLAVLGYATLSFMRTLVPIRGAQFA